MKTFLSIVLLLLFINSGAKANYFIDDITGSDANTGESIEKSWKSLKNINKVILEPGDTVFFRRGGAWTGNFTPKGSGKESAKIVICSYGKGPAPVLDARGEIAEGEKASYTIRLNNQEYIEIRDLKIKNFKPFEAPSALETRSGIKYINSAKMGIYVQGEDCGNLNGINFINLEICDVNGDMSLKHNGGIFMEITRNSDPGSQIPSNFEDVLLIGCWIHDVDRTGFSNTSVWWNRSLTSKWDDILVTGEKHDWYPSEGMIVRNNRFERTGANALIVRAANAPLIEHNLFTHCSIKGSGNASFPFNCDNALFQYNEACYTYFNTEADSWDGKRDADAGGFDSDWNCKDNLFQYNYSHHNGFGGVLICLDGNSKTGFNDGTIVRYNLFENNNHHIVRTSGPVSNTLIYNNLFYSSEETENVMFSYHKSWGGYSDSVAYINNIFYSGNSGNFIDLGISKRNIFNNNLYYGAIKNSPEDSKGIFSNPNFVGNSISATGWKSWLEFLLKEESPAINAGMQFPGMPAEDFQGVNIIGKPDIGPFEFSN